jgi:formylglycine-generating enzyme required for sulfatase activity
VQIIGGVGYRLPFEAEWECAARSGTQTNWWFGNQSEFLRVDDEISKFAWFQKGGARMTTRQVGQKRANWFGLFDILGNVWEWCWDYFQEDYYEESPEIDPIGPAVGTERVLRGGSFGSHSLATRPALRESNPPLKRCDDVGFRVVRTDLRPADKRSKH